MTDTFKDAVEEAVDDFDFWKMKAKYRTVCKECHKDIEQGSQIIRSPIFDKDNPIWIHEECMISQINNYWKNIMNINERQAVLDTIPADDGWDKWFAEYGEGTHGFDATRDLVQTFSDFMDEASNLEERREGCRFIGLILSLALGKDPDLAYGVADAYTSHAIALTCSYRRNVY